MLLLLSYILYRIFTALYPAIAWLLAPFSGKVRKWVRGRFRWLSKAKALLQATPLQETPRLWMHCASLGEFEQGLPVLEAFKKRHPEAQVLLTFFSPSGYELRRQHPLADWVMYLPMDSPRHARELLDEFRPTLAVFVKYEFWWFYLRELKRRMIPAFLIAARFRPKQVFFKPAARGGKWYRQMLFAFKAIMVQDERSKQLLESIGYTNVKICGDPRVDRVLELAEQAERIDVLEQFTRGGKDPLFIIGSSWPSDEEVLLPWLNTSFSGDSSPLAGKSGQPSPSGAGGAGGKSGQPSPPGAGGAGSPVYSPVRYNYKVLIAPHEINPRRIEKLMRRIELPLQRYTCLEQEPLREDTRVLILDTIGLLSRAYRYGQIAYIGGGFGRGIHNILEPAAFGLPVLFGPRYHGFEEAVQLVKAGAASPVDSTEALASRFAEWQDSGRLAQAKRELQLYLRRHRGAARCCLDVIEAKALQN